MSYYRPRKATGKKTGSTMSLDGAPRICSGCGERVVLSGPVSLQFYDVGSTRTSWHRECWKAALRGDDPSATKG